MLPTRPLPCAVATHAHGHSVPYSLDCFIKTTRTKTTALSQASGADGAQTSSLSAERQELTLLPKPQRARLPSLEAPARATNGSMQASNLDLLSEVHQQQCAEAEHQPATSRLRTSQEQQLTLESTQGQVVDRRQEHQQPLEQLNQHSPGHNSPQRHQKAQQTLAQDKHQQAVSAQTQPLRSQQSQPLGSQQLQPHLVKLAGMSAHAASVAAAAEAAIERTRQLLHQAKLSGSSAPSQTKSSGASGLKSSGVQLTRPTPPSPSEGSKSSNRNSSKQGTAGARVANTTSSTSSPDDESSRICYELPPYAYKEYKAAGVVVYDYDQHYAEPPNIRVLLVREMKTFWSIPAGKRESSKDGAQQPESTAARELEEETHGLIPAAVTRTILTQCPKMYWRDGKMVLYFMRYKEGQLLPQMAAARIAAGKGRPEASKVETLSWVPLEHMLAGRGSRDLERSLRDKNRAEKAAAAAAAAATTTTVAVPAANHDSALISSATPVANIAQQSPEQNEQQHVQAPAEQTSQQDGPGDQDVLTLRLTLTTNKRRIAEWLRLLVTEEVCRAGLLMQPLQQQLDSTMDLLQDPATKVLEPQTEAGVSGSDAGSSGATSSTTTVDNSVATTHVCNAATVATAAAANALLKSGAVDQGIEGSSADLISGQLQGSSLSSSSQ